MNITEQLSKARERGVVVEADIWRFWVFSIHRTVMKSGTWSYAFGITTSMLCFNMSIVIPWRAR